MNDMTRSSTSGPRRPTITASTLAGDRQKAITTAANGPAETKGRAAASDRVVSSETLLQGRSHVSITHNGETYQLRATRLGKLILTK
ncbi:hemin uptake protein HemP [Paraburkholderia kururiensis]|uniref:hemin uptake protein HemP n=1 Tax=Paraburkholderia kururiensis TaxID=984307 RepID=UPI000475FF34|nr:hemin uptake protein HemP [Paraburkholderia kururiensis]